MLVGGGQVGLDGDHAAADVDTDGKFDPWPRSGDEAVAIVSDQKRVMVIAASAIESVTIYKPRG